MRVSSKLRLTTSILCIALCLEAKAAAAQTFDTEEEEILADTSDQVIELEPIVVTGSRRETEIKDVPRAILTYDQETVDLESRQTTNLSTSLPKLIPGFGAPLFGNSTRGLTLRGRDPLFLLDGVPISNGDFGVELNSFDPLIIEGIEVLYGPTAAYGNGATGGVIQFFSLNPSQEPLEGKLRFGFDTAADGNGNESDGLSYRVQGVASGTVDNFGYVFSLSFDRQGGLFQPDGQRIAPTRNDDFDRKSLFAKGRYEFDSSRALEAFVSLSQSEARESDFIGAISDDGEDATAIAVPSNLRYANTPEQDTTLASVTYSDENLFGGSFKAQGWYRDEELVQIGSDLRLASQSPTFPDEWPVLFQTNNDSDAFGLRIDYARELNSQWTLNGGIDFQRESNRNPTVASSVDVFEATGQGLFDGFETLDQVAPNRIDSYGIFLQAQYRANDRLTFSGGVRYDYFDYTLDPFSPAFGLPPGFRPGGSGSAGDTTFNIGATYQLSPVTTLFAGFAQGFSLPDLAFANNQLAPGVSISVSDLADPIKVNSYELGIRGDIGPVNYSAAAFYATSKFGSDILISPNTGFGEVVRAPQRNYGFEIATNTSITADIDLGVALSWNDGDIDREDNGNFDPISNLSAQPFKASIIGIWRATDLLTVNGEILYIADRSRSFDDGIEDFSIEGYTVVDAGLTYVLGPGELSLQVTNLFNREYVPVASQSSFGVFAARRFAGVGRRAVVTYTAQF